MAQVVEHILGKDEVGSSSLPNSSKTRPKNWAGFLLFKILYPQAVWLGGFAYNLFITSFKKCSSFVTSSVYFAACLAQSAAFLGAKEISAFLSILTSF